MPFNSDIYSLHNEKEAIIIIILTLACGRAPCPVPAAFVMYWGWFVEGVRGPTSAPSGRSSGRGADRGAPSCLLPTLPPHLYIQHPPSVTSRLVYTVLYDISPPDIQVAAAAASLTVRALYHRPSGQVEN